MTALKMVLMVKVVMVTCAISAKYHWKLFARVWVVSVYLNINQQDLSLMIIVIDEHQGNSIESVDDSG